MQTILISTSPCPKPVSAYQLAKSRVWAQIPMPKVDSQAVVDTFVKAATVWAPSGEEKEMADLMISDFQGLGIEGMTITVDEAHKKLGGNQGNVIIDIPATKGNLEAKNICLSFHLDRVPARAEGVPDNEPVQIEILRDGTIGSKGQRTNIAADDRGGYAAIKEAIKTIHQAGVPHGHLRVIGFVEEEAGLFGASELDPKYLQGLDYGFEFDGGKVGNILHGASGIRRFSAEVEGESAPSIHQRRGKSALLAGTDIIADLTDDQLSPGQLINISNFECGLRDGKDRAITNAVPDRAFIAGELRGRSEEDGKRMHEILDSAFAKAAEKHGVKYSLQFHDMPSFELPRGAEIVKFAEAATMASGTNPKVMVTRGGSDANQMNAKGLPTLVLGAGGKDQHTVKETIHRNDLVRATQIAMNVIAATASPAIAAFLANSATVETLASST